MKKEKLIELKKKRDGSLILYLNTDIITIFFVHLLRPLFTLFDLLDRLSKFSFLLMFIGSVGIGFGVGITVFSQPSKTLAHHSSYREVVNPRQLIWLDKQYVIEDESDPGFSISPEVKIFHQSQYGQLSKGNTLVFYTSNLPMMEQSQLGMPIKVIGSNNGIYNYSVVEIRYIRRKELPNLIAKSGSSLIIYQSDDLLSSQLLVVIASKI